MKCTDNLTKRSYPALRKAGISKRIAALAAAGILLLSGCGTKNYELEHPYDVYGTSIHSVQQNAQEGGAQELAITDEIPYFAQDLCVGEPAPLANGPDASAVEAAGVFHLEEGTVTYEKNMYQKLYPASTTKILTAYTALKHADADDTVTVSAQAANQAGDSSNCGLHEGDQLTLRTLLYGLLLESGNDAADAIAEHVSGGAESFAALMNEEAAALGATHSHFTNPHGLHDENHYTCVYDLYLFLNAALKYDAFETILRTSKYTAVYKDASGTSVTQDWETTNQFLTGEAQAPEGVTVVGGKTGTTNAAGYCLALYSTGADGKPLITIALKADSSEHLYQFMTELLKL